MNSVDAVLVKRYAGPGCPNCDSPLYMVKPEIELGTTFTVDLDTKRQHTIRNRKHGVLFDLEIVDEVGTGHWLPTEVLKSGGSPL